MPAVSPCKVRSLRAVQHSSLQVCAKPASGHGQPPLDKGGFDFLLFIFHEALHVCGRQEIRHILIGNYIRKLND